MSRWLLVVGVVVTGLGNVEADTWAAEAEQPLTGIWTGRYEYPEDDPRPPVEFTVTLIQQGETLLGVIREPNTFGQTGTPHLHAFLSGMYEPEVGGILIKKTYDGTSGVGHVVNYLGRYDAAEQTIDGVWMLVPIFSGRFTLTKDPDTGAGELSGVWTGEYRYPEEEGLAPVPFVSVLVHGPDRELRGWIREPNTFGDLTEPQLQALLQGTWDSQERVLAFTKTYDGTGGQNHPVSYTGRLPPGEKVTGRWQIGNDWGGEFSLEKRDWGAARRALEDRQAPQQPPQPAVPPVLFF